MDMDVFVPEVLVLVLEKLLSAILPP